MEGCPLHTKPFTLERTWDVDGVPVLAAAVSLPWPEAADRVSRRIRRYYQLQGRSFLRYCEKLLFPQARAAYQAALASSGPLPLWRAELDYHVTYNEGGFWSLYTQSREVTEEGPLLTRRGDTWDLAEGCPVPLSRFFHRRSGWRRLLLQTAAAEMERRARAGRSRYREDWRRQLRRSFNPRNYYLTEEGLAFFLPMYAVSGAGEGIPTFLLTWREGGPCPPETGGSPKRSRPS